MEKNLAHKVRYWAGPANSPLGRPQTPVLSPYSICLSGTNKPIRGKVAKHNTCAPLLLWTTSCINGVDSPELFRK